MSFQIEGPEMVFPNMKFSMGIQKMIFGNCVYGICILPCSLCMPAALYLVFFFFSINSDDRFLPCHLFLCRGLTIWPIRNNPKFVLR